MASPEASSVPLKLAVVGHVEVVEFLRVDRVPGVGEIAHAHSSFSVPAGGGGVAAVQLARLAGGATLFTALGDNDHGHAAFAQLERLGVRVHAAFRAEPQRRGVTFVDAQGERTITVIGARNSPVAADRLPWDELARYDGIYFTAGDAAAVRAARQARVLVATPRVGPSLAEAGVTLDALVHSAHDPGERYADGDLDPAPRLVVSTDGAAGGSWVAADGSRGSWQGSVTPGPVRDTYGAGDSFAAGLTLALAQGLAIADAVTLAARCGAACVTGDGPYGAVLDPGGLGV